MFRLPMQARKDQPLNLCAVLVPLLCKEGRPFPPLLCKEGRGEVECRLLYPTQPPLTKGRRERLSPDKARRKRRVRASRPFVNNPG